MLHTRVIVRSLLLAVLFTSPAFAASVTVVPTGNPSSYSVEGIGMDGVTGIQLDIAYDPASLGAPSVTKAGLASGAQFAETHAIRGLIKIAVINKTVFSGSGPIAAITFASKSGTGGILSVSYNMLNDSSLSLASNFNETVETAPEAAIAAENLQLSESATAQAAQAAQAVQAVQTAQTAQAARTGNLSEQVSPGTVTLPSDLQQRPDTPGPPPPTLPDATSAEKTAVAQAAEQDQPSGTPPPEIKSAVAPHHVVYQGISERFQKYGGSKKLSDMAELFADRTPQNFRQEPAILLSDGASTAVLAINLQPGISPSVKFAVNGGKLLSCRQDQQNQERWVLEVLPGADSVKVTVTAIGATADFEYPLTVAPRVKTELALDEQGWKRFLKETGTTKAPLHDLNNDGVRDHLDEFVFVANYLDKIKAQTVVESKPKSQEVKAK